MLPVVAAPKVNSSAPVPAASSGLRGRRLVMLQRAATYRAEAFSCLRAGDDFCKTRAIVEAVKKLRNARALGV